MLVLTAPSWAENTNAADLHLSWRDNSTNEQGFKIERRTGTTGTFIQLALVGANVTSYTDSGLADGTTYCYRVRAFNHAGESGFIEACQTTPTPLPTSYTLTIGKGGSGNGSVTSNPVGIHCGLNCNSSYINGTQVNLSATPSAGSVFSGWSGHADCTDGSVTMNADKGCTATFDAVSTLGTTDAVNLSPPSQWQHGRHYLAHEMKYADVNGDGILDALYFDTANTGGVWVGLAAEAGFAPAEMWLQHGESTPDQMQYADVDGDGKADALYFDTFRSRGVWVSLSTGSGFTAPRMWIQYGDSAPDQIQYLDVDGDGKADALYFDAGKSNCVLVSLSTGSAFGARQPWLCHGQSITDNMQYADVNGDGRVDALYFDTSRSGGIWVSLSTATAFTRPEMWLRHGSSTPDQIQYADVNGDGRADALYFDTSRSKGVWVSLSSGSGFSPAEMWLQLGDSTPDQIQFADVNGDGLADAIYFEAVNGGVWVNLSTGNGFAPAFPWPDN